MKRILHSVSVRVFEKDVNKLPQIRTVFTALLPVDFKKEQIAVHHETALGFNQKTIHILSMKTSKQRHNRLLLRALFNHLSEHDKTRLYHEKETRVNKEGNLYLRLDKQALLHKDYKLTEGGDCFHFTIKLAAYPLNNDTVLKSLNQVFEEFGEYQN
jgi:RNA binding exosome subunit